MLNFWRVTFILGSILIFQGAWLVTTACYFVLKPHAVCFTLDPFVDPSSTVNLTNRNYTLVFIVTGQPTLRFIPPSEKRV